MSGNYYCYWLHAQPSWLVIPVTRAPDRAHPAQKQLDRHGARPNRSCSGFTGEIGPGFEAYRLCQPRVRERGLCEGNVAGWTSGWTGFPGAAAHRDASTCRGQSLGSIVMRAKVAVDIPPSHGENRGSSPLGSANQIKALVWVGGERAKNRLIYRHTNFETRPRTGRVSRVASPR